MAFVFALVIVKCAEWFCATALFYRTAQVGSLAQHLCFFSFYTTYNRLHVVPASLKLFVIKCIIWAHRANNKIAGAPQVGSTSSLFLKLLFNATDDNENLVIGWHRHCARLDVFEFLIQGF